MCRPQVGQKLVYEILVLSLVQTVSAQEVDIFVVNLLLEQGWKLDLQNSGCIS
jgi:hypothetical protein